MRMFPPVYNSYRRLTEDTDIGGHCIPKGIVLYIVILWYLCTYLCMYAHTYIRMYVFYKHTCTVIYMCIYLQVCGSLLTL